MTGSSRRWLIRASAAVLIVVVAGVLASGLWRTAAPRRPCTRAVTAAEAARTQQGQPTTRDETMRQINAQIAFATRQAAAAGLHEAGPLAGLAALSLSRGQLSGDYGDFARAERALDAAFAREPAGLGPHLLRATLNMTLHRLDRVAPDLARVEAYRLPDPGELASARAMRGDLLFYRGRYREALPLYEQAAADGRAAGPALRLATWWSHMGDDAKAMALLDRAECAVSGPQQQLQGFIAGQRGLLAMDRGRWDEARAAFERADAIFPGAGANDLQHASVIGLLGDRRRALALFRRIAARDDTPEAWDAIAGLLQADGDDAGARAAAAEAGRRWDARVAPFPEAASAHAVTHQLTFGDPRAALALARRNYRARPYAPSATLLASALLANGRPAEAVAVLRPALASGWVSADLQRVAAEAFALAGHGAEADAARRRALAINPHSFDRNAGLTWLEH